MSRHFCRGALARYVRRYLRRHFNAVRVARETTPDLSAGEAVICFVNHPGWWDPLIAYFLNGQFLGGRTAYAPIDHTALEQYPVFRKLGFYGVDLNSLEGAKQFLAVTRELLNAFDDRDLDHSRRQIRGRAHSDLTFQPGLGHVAATAAGVTLLPIAVEYTFWEERTPEALIEFGRPIRTQSGDKSKDDWQAELEQSPGGHSSAAWRQKRSRAIRLNSRSCWVARPEWVVGTTWPDALVRC